MNERAKILIDQLEMNPHPEGGYYKEVYRSKVNVTETTRERSALTSIYFLLQKDEVSRWHKVKSDEVWIYLEGAPIELAMMNEESKVSKLTHLSAEETPPNYQGTVPAHIWQAARSLGEYTLVTCLVAPGFDFADFKMMEKNSTIAKDWAKLNRDLTIYI